MNLGNECSGHMGYHLPAVARTPVAPYGSSGNMDRNVLQ